MFSIVDPTLSVCGSSANTAILRREKAEHGRYPDPGAERWPFIVDTGKRSVGGGEGGRGGGEEERGKGRKHKFNMDAHGNTVTF